MMRHVQILRTLASEALHFPERVLHGRRHRSVRRRVLALPPIRSVLFICHGNVCRSPFAAAVFERAVRACGVDIEVDSAGIIGPDRQSPAGALAAAARLDIDLTAHRSKLIGPSLLETADLLVVMAAEQGIALRRQSGGVRGSVVVLGDLDPDSIRRRTILDPWGGDDAAFDASYSRIERCIGQLVSLVAETHLAP